MLLYFIRHGESVTNQTRRFAGQLDVPLTETGFAQAERVADFFNDIPLDAIYSSDLCRAMDTVRPTAARQGLTVIPQVGLREVCAGEWEGLPFEELPKRYPEAFRVWQENIGAARCTGGESLEEAAARADAAARRIAEKHPNGVVAAATHGGILRALISLWTTGSTAAMQELGWVPNASVCVVEFENGKFRVLERGLTTHLGDLVTELPKTV